MHGSPHPKNGSRVSRASRLLLLLFLWPETDLLLLLSVLMSGGS